MYQYGSFHNGSKCSPKSNRQTNLQPRSILPHKPPLHLNKLPPLLPPQPRPQGILPPLPRRQPLLDPATPLPPNALPHRRRPSILALRNRISRRSLERNSGSLIKALSLEVALCEDGRAARVCAVEDSFPFCARLLLEDGGEEGFQARPVGFVVSVAGDVGGCELQAFEEGGVELGFDGTAMDAS